MIDIEELCHQGIKEWQETPMYQSLDKHCLDKLVQEKQETQLRSLLEQIQPFMDAFPKQKQAQKLWRKKGEAWFRNWMKQDEVFLLSDMHDKDQKLFMEVTKNFIQDAREFDKHLSMEDIGQAMRNVWIIVILQRIFQKEVGYHKAMFAYSMLYPYSDNYLDDPSITLIEKQQFNTWFTDRLHGRFVSIDNLHQKKISALVGMIEDVFPRSRYPHVYEGLYFIQDAQILSLMQQDGEEKQTMEKLTYISYRKGGTSVVADGFLIDGEMTEEEIQFCMRYGFMLQIGDDLQDAYSDALSQHQTLVSSSLEEPLDEIFLKLVQYTNDILSPSTFCQDKELLDFVIKDCLLLLFLAVVDREQYYTASLYKTVTECLPISVSFMDELKKHTNLNYRENELWERIDCLIVEVDKETDKVC